MSIFILPGFWCEIWLAGYGVTFECNSDSRNLNKSFSFNRKSNLFYQISILQNKICDGYAALKLKIEMKSLLQPL